MGRINDPISTATQICTDYRAVYGDELVSATVYGSAAGGDFDPVRSDINLLIVLRSMSLESILQSAPIQNRHIRHRCPRPLFMDRQYIEQSQDSFPIEFLNMRGCYQVIIGEDVLGTLTIRDSDLRLQAERELKGKRLHLVRNWLDVRHSSAQVLALSALSLRDFGAVFRALLHLKKVDIPRERIKLFSQIEQTFSLEGSPLSAMLTATSGGNSKDAARRFPDYAAGISHLIEAIDRHQPEEE